MIRFDIETFRRTLAVGTPGKKRELLEMWHQNMDGWDIFPVTAVLPALADPDAKVRILTIKILSDLSMFDKLGRKELLALWRMVADPNGAVRGALVEEIQTTQCGLYRSDLEDLMPLLRHRNSGIRSSVMQLFLLIPHYFDEELCLRIAESAAQENLDIRATITELLENLGQGHLMERGRDDNAGY